MDTSRRTTHGRLGWRIVTAVGAVVLLAGGSQHPDAVAGVPYNQHTAAMLADPAWVPAHLLMLAGMAIICAGYLLGRRDPLLASRAGWTLPWVIVAAGLSVVELIFHTAAKVDQDALLAGDPAPIALIHEALAVVAYPLFGLAVVVLAWRLASGGPSWGWVLAVVGIIGGLLQAVSAPLVVLSQNQAYSPLFKGAIVLVVWLVATAIVGVRTTPRVSETVPEPAHAPHADLGVPRQPGQPGQ